MRHRTAAILARYSERAREAIWQAWLRHPDDERWELLTQYRGEQALAGAALAAAIDPARAATARSVIGAFCLRRGIVPDGDAERALFYLMTGQPEQHRAADPDGTALAAAYRAAAEPVRAALRAAMADAGGLDLVRVVATRDADSGAATEAERAYLAAELARHRDWPRLWRLALDLPLAEAVAAARQLPGDWRPADEAERQLLVRLAAADPARIEAAAGPAVTRLQTEIRKGRLVIDLAPDGSEVAVSQWVNWPDRHGNPYRTDDFFTVRGGEMVDADSGTAGFYSVPGGRLLETQNNVNYLVHFGETVVSTESRAFCVWRRVRGHPAAKPLPHPGVTGCWGICMLTRVPDGFAAVVSATRLLHGTVAGEFRDVTPPGLGQAWSSRWIKDLASDPQAGYLAFIVHQPNHGSTDDLVVLGPDFQVIARCPLAGRWPGVKVAGFYGPGTLITYEHGPDWRVPYQGRVRSWQVGPSGLSGSAETSLSGRPDARLLPAWRTVFGQGRQVYPRSSVWLDAGTLRQVTRPGALAWLPGPSPAGESRPPLISSLLTLSADGRCAAILRDGRGLEVCDLAREEAAELLRRPLARFGITDLTALAETARRTAGRPATIASLGLLRACLEYRFGTDVAIGDQPSALGADDVALSPRER